MKTLKKITLTILLLGIFPVIAKADVHKPLNASYTEVSKAVNDASVGDSVLVPAGTYTWSSTLNITKGISLIGAGVGNTVITSNASGFLIVYNPSNTSTNALMRISGFTFDLGGGNRSGIDLNATHDLNLQTKIRIDHNRFQNIAQGSTQIMFIHLRGERGVIDNNYFTSATYAARANGNFDTGRTFWENLEGIVFGQTDNNMWFEDNIFNVEAGGGVIDCIEGLRYAFRYNTFNVPSGNQMFDLHGNCCGPAGPPPSNNSTYSCFGGELYGNNIVGGTSGEFLGQRGGKFFNFYNNFAGSGWGIAVREENDDSDNPVNYVGPNPPQQLQHVNGTYNWGSRSTLTGAIIPTFKGSNCVGSVCYTGDVPKEGRDYFTESTSPGITSGTLANRPKTCVVGQAYWATEQSTTDLTGMVGPHPATPICGTLYTCTATDKWDEGHSPLPYPHPLRNETTLSCNTLPPAKPTINSVLSKTGTTCLSFLYAITATNNPTSYSATPLPAGLSINTTTGVISGTPITVGATNVTIGATNAAGTSTATLVITIAATASIWAPGAAPANPSEADNKSVELGVKFRSDVAGYITGIRFYKGTANTGTHIGNLWTSTGTKLATVTFAGETSTGWQQANFTTPVYITAGTVYIASYFAPVGGYADDINSLINAVDNPPLHALANSESPNGVYLYTTVSSFPTQQSSARNYWIDVVFSCNIATGIQQVSEQSIPAVFIYPNPFSESTTIDFTNIKKSSGDNLSFHLYNLLGKEVAVFNNISTDKLILEKKNLAEGMYLYKVMLNATTTGGHPQGEKCIETGKLVVQ